MRLLLALLAAALLFGAPQQSPEIRGVVLEPGTNQPVVDAEISLSVQQPGPIRVNGGWVEDKSRKTRTSFDGSFTLPLEKSGPYRVEAKKEGYDAPLDDSASNFAEVNLTAERPAADVKVYLGRPGTLTGTVVDEETRKPIANLRLKPVIRRPPSGLLPGFGGDAKTDVQGRFAASGLAPGEWAIAIGPQTASGKRVLTAFTEQDFERVAPDYERTYWPGGHGEDSALPVPVGSGATVNIGQIPVRKVPYYRVHVRFPELKCEPGDAMQVWESDIAGRGFTLYPLAKASCGKDLLVTGFSRGSYRLILALQGTQGENRGTASVPFVIRDEDIEVLATVLPGVTLDGAVVPAEGAKPPDLTKLTISLRPMEGIAWGQFTGGVAPGEDGKFKFAGVRLVNQTVWIAGLGPTSYVKEIRYNGIPLSNDFVPLETPAVGRELTVVVDDKAGTIAGSVTNGDRAAPGAFVIAGKWPMVKDRPTSGWGRARCDDAGNFRMTGLAPGEYRVIAIQTLSLRISNAAVEQAVAAGKKVEVGPSGFRNVTLEVTDLH